MVVVAIAYADAGQDDRAKATMAQALTTLAEIPESYEVLYQLIEPAAERERYDYIGQIAQAIQSDAASSYDLTDGLQTISEQAILANRYDQALELARQIPSDFLYERSPLFLGIARGLAQAGAFDRAEAIAQEESSETGFQSKILAIVAAQMLLNEQPDEPATALFDRAIQLANELEYPEAKAQTLAKIAVERLRANQPNEAAQLLNQAIAVAQTIEDTSITILFARINHATVDVSRRISGCAASGSYHSRLAYPTFCLNQGDGSSRKGR